MDVKRAAAIAGVMDYLQQEADEREDESVRMRRSSSGWSAYGRKAVARGRLAVQRRRIRRSLAGEPAGRGYRAVATRPHEQERGIDSPGVPPASGMQMP